LSNLAALRDGYRSLVLQAGHGFISLDVLQLKGIGAIKLIVKARQQPHGMTYVGSLTFPFASFSFVVKVQCPEYGVTGVREAVVLDSLLRKYPPEKIEEGLIPGWAADPYDSSRQDGMMRNVAEDEALDAKFPMHPLSRVRRYLATIEPGFQFDDPIYGATPFGG
jgi:hypothetical protein